MEKSGIPLWSGLKKCMLTPAVFFLCLTLMKYPLNLCKDVLDLAYILFKKILACNTVDYVGAFTTNVFAWVLPTLNIAYELVVVLNQRAEKAFLFVHAFPVNGISMASLSL